jgi:hypothetical protein
VPAVVPHIDKLRIEDMLAEVRKSEELAQFFPLYRKEWQRLPRDWISAILNTHSPDAF